MTTPWSDLRCIACARRYPATEVRYRCDCGDLLEVRHDLNRLRAESPDLRRRFDERRSIQTGPHASGVWRYHELVLPDLPIDSVVTCGEGNTPLYTSAALSAAFDTADLALKHEGENPTLSFKDRGMTSGVSWAQHLGVSHVACASTGDTSAAMAAYAAHARGLEAVVFLPHEKVSPEQLAQPIVYGARTLALDTDFDGCMRLVQAVCERHPIYLLNSMNSFRLEGQKTIGLEVCQQRDWRAPDWFVIPVGNAGNVSALGKGMLEAHALGLIDRLPRIAGVQAKAADPLYRGFQGGFRERVRMDAGETLATAIRIGDPVSHDKAARIIQRFHGVVESVEEAELMDAKAAADRAGVAVCPNSGVALAGLRKLRAAGTIPADASVVVILTAHGMKFSQVDVAYHTGALAHCPPTHPNAPEPIAASIEAVCSTLGLG
ncbi:MAG: threonine synthase [Phycisphaerales bacterium]|nr:threonine synthase [Phycisphaerales bacterium]